jgi:hypothetical protein
MQKQRKPGWLGGYRDIPYNPKKMVEYNDDVKFSE